MSSKDNEKCNTLDKDSNENELDYVFEKLQVSPHKNKSTIFKLNTSFEKQFVDKISKKQKRKKKNLVRQAKLVLDKDLKKKRQCSSRTNDQEHKPESSDDSCLNNKKQNKHSEECPTTCSAQFLCLKSVNYNTNEDLNPDELASYFGELLYIPKPMSLMAEMMYA
ncbi:uncharacterized protein LOC130655496 [Hydractinia symbiolongicarpus]|uniref:uncharacterized protein LOC130655496 n=1 Tax=Hydractinia symbiolongicarpus TaxID=13093 RepID=UPI00254A5408|nr:uncharacterized protein LOC130655496 [Hydractinia symbiolongicarpus]